MCLDNFATIWRVLYILETEALSLLGADKRFENTATFSFAVFWKSEIGCVNMHWLLKNIFAQVCPAKEVAQDVLQTVASRAERAYLEVRVHCKSSYNKRGNAWFCRWK